MVKVRHHLFVTATLESGSAVFACRIEAARVVDPEEIERAIAKLTVKPTTQEDLAVLLAARLGATVTLSGRNNDGIETDITAP